MGTAIKVDIRHREAGIAIGPILFIIALLAVLATVMASNIGDFSTATVTDRISADVTSQANLIRTKLNECNLKYGTNNNGDGWPASDTTNGTAISALECEGDPEGRRNIWSGMRPTQMPPPTKGFTEWTYINAGAEGGRCFWTQPVSENAAADLGIVAGLTKSATKFSSQEAFYDPKSVSQRFVIWITMPSGTADEHCTAR